MPFNAVSGYNREIGAMKTILSVVLLLTILILLFPVAGLAQRGAAPTLQPYNPRYHLRIGDTLEINFRFTPEFNQTVTIQPDGFINMRDIPDIYIAGKTTPELAELIRKSYAPILHNPEVMVSLKDFEKPYFVAGGELGRPGKYDLRGVTTVVQAIEIAGGFKDSSKHSQVLLFRRLSEEWTEVKKLDIKKMLHSGDLSEDISLRPGDLVYVPKNMLSKIKPFIPTMSVGTYVPLP